MSHTVATTIASPHTIRRASVCCTIPPLTATEADTLIGALEAILHALADARYPDPHEDDLDWPRGAEDAEDEIPF